MAPPSRALVSSPIPLDTQAFPPSSFGYQRPYPYYFPRYNKRGGGFKRRPCDYCRGFNHRPYNCFKKNLDRKANLGKNSKDP